MMKNLTERLEQEMIYQKDLKERQLKEKKEKKERISNIYDNIINKIKNNKMSSTNLESMINKYSEIFDDCIYYDLDKKLEEIKKKEIKEQGGFKGRVLNPDEIDEIERIVGNFEKFENNVIDKKYVRFDLEKFKECSNGEIHLYEDHFHIFLKISGVDEYNSDIIRSIIDSNEIKYEYQGKNKFRFDINPTVIRAVKIGRMFDELNEFCNKNKIYFALLYADEYYGKYSFTPKREPVKRQIPEGLSLHQAVDFRRSIGASSYKEVKEYEADVKKKKDEYSKNRKLEFEIHKAYMKSFEESMKFLNEDTQEKIMENLRSVKFYDFQNV